MSSDINQPESRISANKRIAKNTIALYLRMIFAMIVSLYTSRVVLATLGVEDFGTYNIVGGIVVLFAFVNETMVGSIQRFINFEIGKGSDKGITDVFSASFRVQVYLSIVVFILAESVGLFYLNNYVKIPDGRLWAANIVYQFSIFSTLLRIIRAPFNAAMISYERMTTFAIVSVVNICLKLVIVFLIMILPSDKLITYAALLSFISAGVTLFYIIYNNRNFILCRITRTINKDQFRKILSFSGWNLLGSVAVLVTYQGINFILNYFYGVAVNAALAIANQVYAATTSFTGSFQTAFRPQITKNYAKGNFNDFFDLVFRTTKYSFFLVIVCAIPLFFQCYGILHLWLGIVPEYTLEFCRYLIMVCVIDALAAPLAMSANATGKIKTYQIIISSILILNFPFSLLLMNLGLSPVWALIVRFIVCCIAFIYRIIYMVRVLNMNLVLYIQKTILPCLFVLVPSIIMVLFAYYNLHLHTVLMAAISLILTATVIFFLGLNKTERTLIKLTLKSKLKL